MYQITCDEYIIHDVRIDNLQVIDAKCSLALNKTGSLTFKMPPTHPFYDKIQKHTSEIALYQDNILLFAGRVLNDELDFANIKNIACEGELSYLLDSKQRATEYHLDGGTANVIETYLKSLIANHNAMVDARKQFVVGNVTVADPNNYLYKESNYEDTLSTINDKLIGTYGGYIQIRHADGKRYIDYLATLNKASMQVIEFGKNIVDMTRYIRGEDVFTALIPLGKAENEVKLTIAGLADSTSGTIVKQGDYIYDSAAVAKWGWLWRTETWQDVTDANNLLSKAKALLQSAINETIEIKLTAIDLHLLDVDTDNIMVGDNIQCVSLPHGLNAIMIVNSMTIDLNNPANTKVTLTLPEKVTVQDISISKPAESIDKQIQSIKDTLNESYPNYEDFNDLKDYMNDNFLSKTQDLSAYAKIVDVNAAFDQLATALQGV